VSLYLDYIQEFDEVKGKLGLTALVYVQWRDETVSWDPSESKIYSLTYMDDPFNAVVQNTFDHVILVNIIFIVV
jgi:hypothetical protein